MGELIYVIVKEVEAANQSNRQGAADAGLPAEEGQAKKGRGSYSRAEAGRGHEQIKFFVSRLDGAHPQ